MANISVWLLKGHIIYNKLSEQVQPEDIQEIVEENIHMMAEQTPSEPVHIIYDIRDTKLQGSISNFHRVSSSMFRNEHMGCLLLVNNMNNQLANTMAAIIAELFDIQYQEFFSLDESLEFLKTKDVNLPNITQEHLNQKLTI